MTDRHGRDAKLRQERCVRGDTPNDPLDDPFTVNDLNPDDDYLANTLPGGPLAYQQVEAFEMQLESLTVSSSATLRVIGVNPVIFRVTSAILHASTVFSQASRDAG